jgi:hypothetical protein
MNATACYGMKSASSAVIDFNVGHLGMLWFDSIGAEQDELMIHELAHHRADNHYSEEYRDACCELGARLKRLAMEQPDKMKEFMGMAAAVTIPPAELSSSEGD